MTELPTALVALDWGTSSLRAYRMDAGGAILQTRADGCGIQHLPAPGEDGFEAAFEAICGDWLDAAPGPVPVVAAGMVGSAQGWREVPYLRCPAGPESLAAASLSFETRKGRRVTIAPGLLMDGPDGAPDVMRGEEIQIAGTLAAHPEAARDAMLVLPGTHSKWAQLEDGRVVHFATYMTGELFAVLRAHSILGRLMPQDGGGDPEAFGRGLERAREGGFSHALFSVRTLGLTGRIAPEGLADYMSGLLIGHEVLSAAGELDAGRPLFLVGEGALCRRYERALEQLLGRAPAAQPGNPAPAGLFALAGAAGFLAGQTETSNV
ncbi:2-dehydro-3-deoxygalactonokinase [Mangrovicoccus sp. HB161399]|uniref:2-dehydro-3-deoxygalactonokinase n=1 Tax=Mangrovicoccus sp. HB161399 TaxID=2720392 RepID=UPI001553DA07|nr:2-dehydro-3-deoxygalactonokinase [Mangrovicoccus sp. HB161399]